MDDIILFGISIALGAILGYLAAIIIIALVVVIIYLIRKLRRRGSYNLEYPADFTEPSSADDDMLDRFQGKHWK